MLGARIGRIGTHSGPASFVELSTPKAEAMKTPFLSLLGWVVVSSAAAAAPAFAQSWPAGITPVRGVVTSVSGNVLMVNSQTGPVKIQLGSPLKVYKRTPSDLSHVNS